MSRDVKHHLKYVQKKMLKASRLEESAKTKTEQKEEDFEEQKTSEEKKIDPHHRTPRVFKKRDYH